MYENFTLEVASGILIVGICVLIQGAILLAVFTWLKKFYATLENQFNVLRNFFVVIGVVWILSIMHLLQVAIWAVAYTATGALDTYYQAFYFSIVTLSTVGYGDLTVPDGWKLFGGLEALMGPLMFGWSASFLFGMVNKFYQIRSQK